jgi:hypothetical protein
MPTLAANAAAAPAAEPTAPPDVMSNVKNMRLRARVLPLLRWSSEDGLGDAKLPSKPP